MLLNRLAGSKIVLNPDGLEWKRKKWGMLGRCYIRALEWIGCRMCHVLVADSKALVEIYKGLYSREPVYIPYGAGVCEEVSSDSLVDYGLEPGKYILQACRLEPENNVDLVIDAHKRSSSPLPLAILGDAPPKSAFKEKLLATAGPNVRFLGSVYGPGYQQVVAHAALYVHAHEVGGTNPSLLEAMAVGKAPLYLDVPFNREVVGEAGVPFQRDVNDLAAKITEYTFELSSGDLGRKAQEIIRERYNWTSVISQYEELFENLLDQRMRTRQ